MKPINPKGNQSWMFIGRTDAEAETPILWLPDAENWKRPWRWERMKAGGEGGYRRLDGWMISPTQWTQVWASSGRWWRTGKRGLLHSIGLQSWTQLSDWTTTTKGTSHSKGLSCCEWCLPSTNVLGYIIENSSKGGLSRRPFEDINFIHADFKKAAQGKMLNVDCW